MATTKRDMDDPCEHCHARPGERCRETVDHQTATMDADGYYEGEIVLHRAVLVIVNVEVYDYDMAYADAAERDCPEAF